MTFKPSGSLNFNISGQWDKQIVKLGIRHSNLTSLKGHAALNYYLGDFSFSAMVSTPSKNLINYQIERKSYGGYQLSAMWNHANLAVEVNGNNLFFSKNNISDFLTSDNYTFNQIKRNKNYNQYATLKVVYSFDYGKKTSKSPKYESIDSESAILKKN